MKDKDLTTLIILLAIGFFIWKMIQRKTELSGVSNEESWEIERDEDGRLKNIIIHRNVKPNIG